MVMTDFRRAAFPARMPCGSDALAEVRVRARVRARIRAGGG